MLTGLAIVALVLLSVGLVFMVCRAATGDWFAWFWVLTGGIEHTLEFIGALLGFVLKELGGGGD